MLHHVLDEIVVPREAGRFVARARPGRDELTNGITRLLREDLGRVFRPHAIERAGPQRHRERSRDAGEHGQEYRPRDARTQAGALSSGRDHLRRRRLASRERGGQRIAARQRGGHRERRGGTTIGLGLQTAENGPLDRRVERTHHAGRRGDRSVFVLTDELRHRRRGKRAAAREELIDDEAQRKDVAPGGDLASEELLGRHVRRRARTDILDPPNRGQAEVHHAHSAGAVEHDVGRLQIAMDDAALMGGGESRAQLARDVGGFVFRESANPAERAREVFPVDVLHREIQEAVGLADVVDAAHVGVGDLPRGAHLVVKLSEAHRIVAERFRQELQRDRLAEAQIVRPIHLPHPAAAEETDDPVAAVEQRAGSKAPVADRIRRGEPAARRRFPGGRRCPSREAAGRQSGRLARAHRQRVRSGRTSARRTEPGRVRQDRAAARAHHAGIMTCEGQELITPSCKALHARRSRKCLAKIARYRASLNPCCDIFVTDFVSIRTQLALDHPCRRNVNSALIGR